MPCRDYGYEEMERREREERHHRITRLLCEACALLKANGIVGSDDLEDWREAHERADRQERARERQQAKEIEERKAALQKLSPYERKLLGIARKAL